MQPDRAIGAILLLLAAAYGWLSRDIASTLVDDPLGPRFYPGILAVLLAICSAVLIARPSQRPAAGAAGETRRLLATIGMTAAYLIVMPIVGYALSTPIYLGALARLLGCRRARQIVATAIGLTVVVGLVFGTMLGVRLPRGRWLE
jgi:putative tricarboxylic transport membrane protein